MEPSAGNWLVEHRRGGAQELHDAEPAPRRQLLVHDVVRPAVVLGSAQQVPGIGSAAEEAGFDVARRRSGGGAVLLVPGRQLWVDVVIPAGDPHWDDDVERATWWLGEAWATLVARDADGGRVQVHRRGVTDRDLGRTVCFAALGPGEVSLDGRKVVGISQRRTRAYARFQCVVHHEWDPSQLLRLLGAPARGELAAALHDRAAALPVARRWDVVEDVLPHLG